MRYHYWHEVPDNAFTRAVAVFGAVCTAIAWGALGAVMAVFALGALIGLFAGIVGIDL